MIILILVLFTLLSAIRLLRWLGIVQQKEYRFDRLQAFAHSNEGIKELLRLLPLATDLSRTNLKRPAITPKIGLVALGTVLLIILYIRAIFAKDQAIGWDIFHIFLIYTAIPLWVGLTLIPIQIVSAFVVWRELRMARNKIVQSTTIVDGKKKPLIIGITGSYGKTSTKHLLTFLLEEKYTVFTTPFSYNTKYSISKTINRSYAGQEIIVLEYAAYTKDEIKELAKWFKPDIAIITGLAPQHLELFGSLKNIVIAKAALVQALPRNASVYFYKSDNGAKQIVYEGRKNKELRITSLDPMHVQAEAEHIEKDTGKLVFSHNNKKIRTPFIGLQYFATIILSLGVSKDLGISLEKSLKRLSKFESNKNFIHSYTLKTGAYVVDDGGSANPSGARAALQLLNSLELPTKMGKKYFVFPGIIDLGSQSDQVHSELAQLSKEIASTVLYVGQQGKAIFKEKSHSFKATRQEIIEILHHTTKNDIILIEGRMPGWFLIEIARLKQDV